MFNQTITNTPFTTLTANNFFKNITGSSFRNDVSFLSTLRAFLHSRITPDDNVQLVFTESSYSEGRLSERSASEWVKFISLDFDSISDGTLVVHSFHHTEQSANYAWLELMKSTFTSVYDDWVMLDKITTFFTKSFYTVCFVNPARKCTVVFVDNLNLRKLHYLQCATFALLPYYFNVEEGVSELEMELAHSFREKTKDNYLTVLNKYAERLDFRAIQIKNLLKGFENQYESQERDRTKRDLESNLREITNLNERIGEFLRVRKDLEIKLTGLECKLKEGAENSEIMDYFLRNRRLNLESVVGTSMTFIVQDYISFYDEDLAKRMIENKNSMIYDVDISDAEISEDDMKTLMTAVFINGDIKIKTCAAYKFEMNGNVSPVTLRFDSSYADCMPNIHITEYHCMGSYSKYVNEMLANRDYIGAIEQCVASCKSLNFGDSTVLGEFMENLYGVSRRYNTRCFELPTGEVVTPSEAVDWIKSQEE